MEESGALRSADFKWRFYQPSNAGAQPPEVTHVPSYKNFGSGFYGAICEQGVINGSANDAQGGVLTKHLRMLRLRKCDSLELIAQPLDIEIGPIPGHSVCTGHARQRRVGLDETVCTAKAGPWFEMLKYTKGRIVVLMVDIKRRNQYGAVDENPHRLPFRKKAFLTFAANLLDRVLNH